MKINEHVSIKGENIILVPYEAHHVPKYHEWMKGEELQKLTASEPLSLAEEYDMQKSWREDEDKCTFIVLDKHKWEKNPMKTLDAEIEAMIGDVNLFFNDEDDRHSAELELMIAESSARGQGRGKEAMLSMMMYGFETLHVTTFTAKIGYGNAPSLRLFQGEGFQEVSRSDVFQETTFSLQATDGLHEKLKYRLKCYSVDKYPLCS